MIPDGMIGAIKADMANGWTVTLDGGRSKARREVFEAVASRASDAVTISRVSGREVLAMATGGQLRLANTGAQELRVKLS